MARLPAGSTAARRKVHGVTLYTVEAGPPDGPLVLLLHGFPEFWYGWRRQIGPLAAAGLRVVAPDQRGYDLSDKPRGIAAYALDRLANDVIGLAESCGRASFSLVGHDWGGIVAWRVAARHPGRVTRLAIINAPHPDIVGTYARRHPTQVLRSLYVGFFQLPLVPEAVLRAGRFALLRGALQATSRPGTFSSEELDRYEEAWSQPEALTAMLAWYRALPYRALPRDGSGRIRAPTLVIWGARDHALERGLVAPGLAMCDEARVLWLEEATHWVQHEEPDRVNAALIAFLEG